MITIAKKAAKTIIICENIPKSDKLFLRKGEELG
jgi:hypothetical protein